MRMANGCQWANHCRSMHVIYGLAPYQLDGGGSNARFGIGRQPNVARVECGCSRTAPSAGWYAPYILAEWGTATTSSSSTLADFFLPDFHSFGESSLTGM